MRVVRHLSRVRAPLERVVLTLGNFDGVHRGHRAIVETAVSRARERGARPAVLTFEPHPRSFFEPEAPSFLLNSESGKLRLLAASGLDGVVLLTFDAELASLPAEEFVEQILVNRLAITGAVIGFNFHFGLCPKNLHGLFMNTSIASASLWPRRRNSRHVSVSHCGPLSPQSLALFTQSIFVPYISIMSTARCGVTLLTG